MTKLEARDLIQPAINQVGYLAGYVFCKRVAHDE